MGYTVSASLNQIIAPLSVSLNQKERKVVELPLVRVVPNSTIGGQINMTFLVEFLLNCGIWGRW